jgi:hypothetical protein
MRAVDTAISSRCHMIRCPSPTSENIYAYLVATGTDEDDALLAAKDALNLYDAFTSIRSRIVSRGGHPRNWVRIAATRFFIQSKKLRNVSNILNAARDFAHLINTVSPCSGELHNDLCGALCDAIKLCRATKSSIEGALITATTLTASLDHDITMASKPIIHYEKYLIRACIILKEL